MDTNEVLKIFGQNLHKARINAKLSLKELSEMTQINEKYLKRIEEGTAFGLPVSYVFILSQALKTKAYILCDGL